MTLLIATPSLSLPLTFPTTDPICTSMSDNCQAPVLPHSPTFASTSPRKVHVRAFVALTSGHTLSYIHARHRNLEPTKTYDGVDVKASECIKMLVDKQQPHMWLHFDATALVFCSHILLQQAQGQYLTKLPHATGLDEQVQRLPFAGLICVLRAELAVLEITGCMDDDVVTRGEVKGRQFKSRMKGMVK